MCHRTQSHIKPPRTNQNRRDNFKRAVKYPETKQNQIQIEITKQNGKKTKTEQLNTTQISNREILNVQLGI